MKPEARAEQEAGGYVWFRHPEPGFSYCLSQSEAVYVVSEQSCTCPYATIHHGDCKHQMALRAKSARRAA